MNDASTVFSIIQQTLSDSHNELSVSMMCEAAGVSRSGYYAWLQAAPARADREERDHADFELILAAYKHRGYSKGARGIYMCLIHQTPPVVMNLKKIRRLMKKYGLRCPIRKANPYRRMAKAMKTNNYAPNLLDREFECYGPRLVLLTDITYIPWCGAFLYLSVIMDAYTKQVLAFEEIKARIDDYMSYYNNERYQWDLAKLSPNEYYDFVTTGVYPLDIPNKPSPPTFAKTPDQLGVWGQSQK